jgi:hypothetical protein
MIAKLKAEPAVVIGVIAACILAVAQTLAGNGIISSDVFATIAGALDPAKGGWALPIILSIVTRFFVFSPPAVQKIANAATNLAPGTVVDIGNPPSGPAPAEGTPPVAG